MQKSTFVPFISLITFAGFLDTHLLLPVMSLFASELGVGVGVTGIIVGLYSIVNTPANVVFGRITDRTGFKPLLIAGLVTDALAMFFYTLVSLPWHLLLVRVLHGLGGGMVGPATMSAMTRPETGRSAGTTMAFYGIALASATLVGYAAGGTLASRFGFDSVFLAGGCMLLAGIVLTLSLPHLRPVPQAVPSGEGGWSGIGRLLKRRKLIGPYTTIFAQYFSLGGVVTILPLYVKSLGLEAMHTGMAMAAFSVLFILTQVPLGRLGDRFRKTNVVMAGLVIGIASLVLLPATGIYAIIVAAMAVYGIAHGLMFPSVSALVAEGTAAEERGLGTGIFHALLTGGVAAGAPVMGWIGEAAGLEWGLASSSAILLLATGVVMLTGRNRHSE